MDTRQTTFDSIAQRALFGYRFTFSEFEAAPHEQVTAQAQAQLHALMDALQARLYEQPSCLGLPLDADESYPWYLCNNQRPELDAKYRAIYKSLYDFYRFLYYLALTGALNADGLTLDSERAKAAKLSLKPCYTETLKPLGITLEKTKASLSLRADNADIPAALKALATLCSQRPISIYHEFPYLDFCRCAWQPGYDYLWERADAALGLGGQLQQLRADCLARGYEPQLHRSTGRTEFGFSLILQSGVGGFKLTYNPRKGQQFAFGTLNGIGEKRMLEHFHDLDESMQAYFLHICRPCNQCMGCTKGGRNKPFTITLEKDGQTHVLCPMFPQHEWPTLDQHLIGLLFRYHDLQAQYA